jgi:hypothetical protein
MSKIGKSVIPILLLLTMLMSLLPVSFVSAIDNIELDEYTGQVGDEIEVSGEDVTAGATVNIYWDAVDDTWDGEKGLLGSTEAKSSGEFEFEFDIPEAENGKHYVWVKDKNTGETDVAPFITVETDIDLSSTSGRPEDKVDVEGTGFDGDGDLAIILFSDYATAIGTFSGDEDTGEEGDGDEDEFSFTTDESPIVPGTVNIYVDNVLTLWDDGDGTLSAADDTDGDVNYVTGDIDLEFEDAPDDGAVIEVQYRYFEDVTDEVNILTTAADTDGVGSFSREVTVPDLDEMDEGDYDLVVFDNDGNDFVEDFTVGATITLEFTEGRVGLILGMEGRGFDEGAVLDDILIERDGESHVCMLWDPDTTPVVVDEDGEFDLDFVIPQVEDEEEDYDIVVTAGMKTVTAEFEVTDLAKIEVTPTYGLPGEEVEVKGWNFVEYDDDVDGTKVTVTLAGEGDTTFEPDDDGYFEGTFTIPGVEPEKHDLLAEQDDFNIADDTDFKAGLIVVVASPTSRKVGQKVTFTGTGFTPDGKYNATFGDESITSEGDISSEGTFSKEWYIPTMDTGTYDVVFVDDIDNGAEITVTIQVEVTETTWIEIEPSSAPNEYDIIIRGYNFKNDEGLNVKFTLYNGTEDDMDYKDVITKQCSVYDEEEDDYIEDEDVKIAEIDDVNGRFDAWWEVFDDEELSLGEYILLVEVGDDWMADATLTIVEKTVTVRPRKTMFRIGETVAFDIVNSFEEEGSYIKIWDSSGALIWKTDDFDDWVKVDSVYRVPYFQQTASLNLMMLDSDVPLGTYKFTMYDDDDDEIESGGFAVAKAATSVVEEKVDMLSEDIKDLQDDLSGLEDEIGDVRGDIADAKSAADQATAAANDAKSAADALSGVKDVAADAKDAADDAKNAAQEAKEATQGITNLVYIAIGGSIIAALAAIVGLMQFRTSIAR